MRFGCFKTECVKPEISTATYKIVSFSFRPLWVMNWFTLLESSGGSHTKKSLFSFLFSRSVGDRGWVFVDGLVVWAKKGDQLHHNNEKTRGKGSFSL